MKFSISVAAALLPAAALSRSHYKRDDITTTDQYLFHITLAQFNIYRDADIPATLDFTSDGCTASPDNPLGFDYVSLTPASSFATKKPSLTMHA